MLNIIIYIVNFMNLHSRFHLMRGKEKIHFSPRKRKFSFLCGVANFFFLIVPKARFHCVIEICSMKCRNASAFDTTR